RGTSGRTRRRSGRKSAAAAVSSRPPRPPSPKRLADRRATRHRPPCSGWSSSRSLRVAGLASKFVEEFSRFRQAKAMRAPLALWLKDAARCERPMPGDWTFYMAAVPAVVLLGLSKGGFSGLSTLAMPLLALAISPVRAAAIVLPILIVQDWVSVWAFRRDFSPHNLLILIPSSMIGIAAGWLLAARVSEDAVRLAVGVISIVFVFYMLIRGRLG